MKVEEFNFDPTDFSAEGLAKNGTELVAASKEPEANDEEVNEKPFDESTLLDFSDQMVEDNEDEDVKEETSEKDHSREAKSKSSSSPNHWLVFAKTLEESGLISEFTDEDFEQLSQEAGSPAEAIVALANKSIGGAISEHIQQQDAEYKEFIAMRDAGVDLNEYAKLSRQTKGYEAYKLEDVRSDEDLQRKVVREYFTIKGMDNDEIDDSIESLEDTGKLAKRAEVALTHLHKYKDEQMTRLKENAAKADQDREAAVQKQLTDMRKFIDDTPEIIPGVKHNKQIKDKLYDMITKQAGVINGQPVNAITLKMYENPTKYNLILAELQRLGVFDGKWESITKVAKTKAISELEKVVESGVNYKTNAPKNGYADIYKELKNLK